MSVIVFTAILGTSDSLKPAPKGADRCVCFVDDPDDYSDPKGWELRGHIYGVSADPRREAWHVRAIPHAFFSEYDRIVWIDASFTLTDLPRLIRDAGNAPVAAIRHHRRNSCYTEAREIVKIGQAPAAPVERQMAAYRAVKFDPKHLSISCVIVRDRSEQANRFNATWDEQIQRHPGDNTQLSLDYSAWANGFAIAPLRGERHHNPYAEHDHADHKRRRKPYVTVAA